MQFRRILVNGFAAAMAMVVSGALPAFAFPDLSRVEIINEDDGFSGVCAAPCYSIEKVSEVYLAGNPTAPAAAACGPTENTFVYKLTNIGGTLPAPGIPVTEFEISAPFSLVTSAGFIPVAGIAPTSTTISPLDVVSWTFPGTPSCPGCLFQGITSKQLFICATGGAGSGPNNASTTALVLDAPGECLAPIPEQVCDIELDKTCCIPQPIVGNDDVCDGKIVRAVFEVVDGNCSDGTNSQGGKAKCSGPNPIINPLVDDVDVVLTKDASKYSLTPNTNIAVTETFEILRIDGDGEFKSKLKIDTTGPGGTQSNEIHTSCSKAIRCDDQFGALKLVEIETTNGGTTICDTLPPTGTQCGSPAGGVGTPCDQKLVEAVFEFNPSDCQVPLGNPQSGEASCTGDASDSNLPVSVLYTGKKAAKTTVAPSSGIGAGDTFRVTATGMKSLHPNMELLIQDNDSIEQSIDLHVSCSKPLACGDVFGSLTLTGFTTKSGMEVDCSVSPGAVFMDTCECPVAPPTPHCTSKLEGLQLVYLKDLFGADCSVTNDQDGKGTCTGDDLTDDDVSINVITGGGVSATPDMNINEKDIFTILKDGGGGKLPSSIKFDATDGSANTQTVEIHTSCSKELNLGDRFGDFAVFGMDRGDGNIMAFGTDDSDSDDSDTDSDSDSYLGTGGEDGLITLGCEIEYQYTVTNPNATGVENVQIDDDKCGLIVDNETLAPSESKTFFKTKILFETTTNEAVATGDLLGGGQCEAGIDEVTVDVTLPPSGSFSCKKAKPIDELSMEWAGAGNIRVRAYDGSPGSTVLLDQDNVAPGDIVTVSGMGGSPKDQIWEIFVPGTLNLIGASTFHISCSDQEMNGTEDCGGNQGNGKNNSGVYNNDWLLEGMSGDETLTCTPTAIGGGGGPPPGCGLGAELVLLLPGLMWLARRRRDNVG